jgi:hypothetical protein
MIQQFYMKCHRKGGFNKNHLLLTVLGTRKYKIKALADLGLVHGQPASRCVLSWQGEDSSLGIH